MALVEPSSVEGLSENGNLPSAGIMHERPHMPPTIGGMLDRVTVDAVGRLNRICMNAHHLSSEASFMVRDLNVSLWEQSCTIIEERSASQLSTEIGAGEITEFGKVPTGASLSVKRYAKAHMVLIEVLCLDLCLIYTNYRFAYAVQSPSPGFWERVSKRRLPWRNHMHGDILAVMSSLGADGVTL